MRPACCALLAALALSLPTAVYAAPPHDKGTNGTSESNDEVVLAVGETKTFPAKDVRNYSEGAPGIIDIKLTSDNGQFVVRTVISEYLATEVIWAY